MKKYLSILGILVSTMGFGFQAVAVDGPLLIAQGDLTRESDAEGFDVEDLTIQDVNNIIKGIVCWALWLGNIAVVGFLVYSGFLFFTAQGVPAKVDAAKKNLTYVLIGVAVIVGVYVIIGTVATTLGQGDYSFFSCEKVKLE